ncbi:hypothetical protein LIA77_08284 [Sarocladium implicatum]|nr:hypothetical protein LIA77_08284 [Sarocladium implicatum]
MRFTIAASAFLALATSASAAALPAGEASAVEARGNCVLIAHWEKNWSQNALRRYSVAASAKTGGSQSNTREMLAKWVEIASDIMGPSGGQKNTQCWVENDNLAYCHGSYYEGALGHKHYIDDMQGSVNAWRTWSNGCDVDSGF